MCERIGTIEHNINLTQPSFLWASPSLDHLNQNNVYTHCAPYI